jgi:hypothetical protein
VAGEQRLGDGEDVFAPLAVTLGQEALLAIECVGLGAEDAGVDVHGAHVSLGD